MAANSNNVRAVFGPRRTNGSGDKTIDFVTIATLGNATDFGDSTANRRSLPGASNNTRGLIIGGEESSSVNKIEFIEMATTGNSTDFGDLTTASQDSGAAANNTRALTMSGYLGNSSYGTTVQAINITGLGNKVRAISAGGFNNPGVSNVIESSGFETGGTFTDFGDLTVARQQAMGSSNQHGGLQEFHPRSPELYSPTGKVVPRGKEKGDLGLMQGNAQSIGFVQISTTGNQTNFGDWEITSNQGAGVASSTRGIRMGGRSPTYFNNIGYITMATKGNGADFGDITQNAAYAHTVGNETRGIRGGGNAPSPTDVIDYITIATFGNATDFGDTTVTKGERIGGQCNSSTRGLFAGGGGAPYVDVIDYVTISSTSDATDFGNLGAARSYVAMSGSDTRGLFVSGYTGSYINTVEYATIASTSNSTDFGDLSVSRFACACNTNNIRSIASGGWTGSSSNVIDYLTIASTGDALDFGDLIAAAETYNSMSNGHGGLS